MTIAYAAPEQLNGAPASIESDIFSLGMILHFVLYGRAPSRGPDHGASIVDSEFSNKDLFAIQRKALAYEAKDRYRTVDALLQDLDAFRSHHPVAARNGGRLYAIGKFYVGTPRPVDWQQRWSGAMATGLCSA